MLDASQHHALPAFAAAMLAYVLPLTGLTLVVLAVRAKSGAGGERGGRAG